MTEPLTLQQVASKLGVHYMTAYKYIRTGRLSATKVGSIWNVDPDDLDRFLSGAPDGSQSSTPERSRRLHERLLAGDELGSWAIVEDGLASGLTAEQVHLELLGPALTQVGDRWVAGEIDVADEHLASTTTVRVLGRMAPLVTARGRSKGTVVLAGAAGDQHALPTALLSDLLRIRRFAVVDLGANTPSASLVKMTQRHDDLVAVGICASSDQGSQNVAQIITDLRATGATMPIFVGGSALRAEHAVEADHITTSGLDACEFVEKSLALRR